MSVEIISNKISFKSMHTVLDANYFRTQDSMPTVTYLLNQGYCNAKCSHCYVNNSIHDKTERPLEQAYIDILKLKQLGNKVILRGTEILMNPNYLELFSLVKQTYLQTNGLILAQKPYVLSLLRKAGINHLILTYPLFDDDIISINQVVAEKVIKSCRSDFSITLSVIVTKKFAENISLLSEACKRAVGLGVRAIKFIRLMPINPEHINLVLNTEQSIAVLSELNHLKQKYAYNELVIQTPGCFGMFSYRRSLNKDKYFGVDFSDIYDCPAGKKLFVIDVNNNIYPCVYLMSKEHNIGKFEGGKLVIKQFTGKEVLGKLRTEECVAFKYYAQTNGGSY